MSFDGLEATTTLDDFELDTDLVSEALLLDGEEETPNLPAQVKQSGFFDEGEEDATGEFVVDVMEMAIQFFGHERYQMPETKKAVLATSYGKLAKKYEDKVPGIICQFKEEGFVILMTLLVMFGSYKAVKALREEDAKQLEETQGGEHGSQSE